MSFKSKFPEREKKSPESAAEYCCDEIRKKMPLWECQICKPETAEKTRREMHTVRDEYNRDRGSGYGSRSVQLADRVRDKLLEIATLNPQDWTNRRLGQQFRRLEELLDAFNAECRRSTQRQ